MTEPPVGKDSSFETLLDEYKKAIYELEDANELPDVDYSDMAAEKVDASRAALENLFAKQREEIERLGAFSRTAYLSANRELEAKLAASYLAIERRDAQVASLQSEIERQREEIAELKRALEIDGGAANYFLATVAQLRAELERQRETTPT